MDSVRKFFRKYIFSGMLILILFVVVNIAFVIGFAVILQVHTIDTNVEIAEIADGISQTSQGQIQANEKSKNLLEKKGSWAMILDDAGNVIWEYEMPEKLPEYYSVPDVAKFSRWYLEEYPVLVQKLDFGLLVVGYQPNDMSGTGMTKFYYVTDSEFVKVALIGGVLLLVMNMFLVLFLFLKNIRKVEKSVMPIMQGIEDFSHGREVLLPETGELVDVNRKLNHAGQYMLKRDKARADWINGVSHDVRTPLSVIMGYAGGMEDDSRLPSDTRKQAECILAQAEKMKHLIADLNLTSKLEYAMQPLNVEKVDLFEMGRLVVAEFLNNNVNEKYTIDFDVSGISQEIPTMSGDKALLKRMLTNLIQNCISHNQNGCNITFTIQNMPEKVTYIVSDDGIGMTEEQLEYQNCGIAPEGDYQADGETAHGVGLKLVRQIVSAHEGTIAFHANKPCGLSVEISFMCDTNNIVS